jgi:hypothetical protein
VAVAARVGRQEVQFEVVQPYPFTFDVVKKGEATSFDAATQRDCDQ